MINNENTEILNKKMEQPTGSQPTTIKTNPRKSFIAFLFSLLFPGLGQIYNGQPRKAIVFFGLLLLIPLLFGTTRWTTFFYGFCSLYAVDIALRIYIIIDGIKCAKKQHSYTLKPYNTWYYYLLIAIGIFAVLCIYDTEKVLGTKTFIIPSVANSPTLQSGDRLVADLRAYNNNEPDYGDFVVYSGLDGQAYVFRVVGKPNDSIEIIDNIVIINGKRCKTTYIKEAAIDDISVVEFEEELPNGHKHLIYKYKQYENDIISSINKMVVPSDNYYLLGDNRDNAADSRYEGFISKDRIKGRIIFSYWGQTGTKRMNIDFRNK